MTLPIEVEEVCAVLRRLPQSWLADTARRAALEADAGRAVQNEVVPGRARALLVAMQEMLDAHLALLANLPGAIQEAFERVRDPNFRDLDQPGEILWVTEDAEPRLFVAADRELATFRTEMREFLQQVINGLDGPPAAPATPTGGPPNTPDDSSPTDDTMDDESNDAGNDDRPSNFRMR